MIRYFGLFLILIACTVYGFIYGEEKKKRLIELRELERALCLLKSHINYGRYVLPEALSNVSEKCTGIVSEVFKEVSILLEQGSAVDVHEAFFLILKKKKDKIHMKDQDNKILLELCKTLGEIDIDGHNSIFEITIEDLRKNISFIEKNIKADTKMYRYLGFTVGAMLVIVLI